MSERMNRVGAVACVALVVAQLLLMLLSWMISTAQPDSALHSLLSGEGIRWMVGHFTHTLAHPIGACLLLCAVAYGTLTRSALHHAIRDVFHRRRLSYRQRFAMRMTLLSALLLLALWLALLMSSQSVLLSAVGGWFPSSFSRGLIPILAFIVTACSLVYGSFSGNFSSLAEAFRALYHGPVIAAPFVPIYILTMMFVSSLIFVLG